MFLVSAVVFSCSEFFVVFSGLLLHDTQTDVHVKQNGIHNTHINTQETEK